MSQSCIDMFRDCWVIRIVSRGISLCATFCLTRVTLVKNRSTNLICHVIYCNHTMLRARKKRFHSVSEIKRDGRVFNYNSTRQKTLLLTWTNVSLFCLLAMSNNGCNRLELLFSIIKRFEAAHIEFATARPRPDHTPPCSDWLSVLSAVCRRQNQMLLTHVYKHSSDSHVAELYWHVSGLLGN